MYAMYASSIEMCEHEQDFLLHKNLDILYLYKQDDFL